MSKTILFFKVHRLLFMSWVFVLIVFHANIGHAADADSDGVDDSIDNCLGVYNPLPQMDNDLDGYGNMCDCDGGNDGVCNVTDAWLFAWCGTFAQDPNHYAHVLCARLVDMNADGQMNDYGRFKKMFPGWMNWPKVTKSIFYMK